MGTQELRKHIQKILFESITPANQSLLKQPEMPKAETPQNWQSVIDEEKDAKPAPKRKSKSVFKTKRAEKALKPFEK